MYVSVTCAGCGHAFRVDAKFAGKRGKCPNAECRQVYTVPSAAKPAADDDDLWDERLPEEDSDTGDSSRGGKSRAGNSLSWGKSAKSKGKVRKAESVFSRLDGMSFFVGAGVAAVVAVLLMAVVPMASAKRASSSESTPPKSSYVSDIQPVVKKYCGECHGGDNPEAGISFAKYADEAALLKDRKTWERSFHMISEGIMPPADSPQPTADEKATLVEYLEGALFRIDCSKVSDPGRVTIRRLNRTEYNNTIRDLVGVTVRPADDFPSDDVGYGFDNIGDVLSLPPLLMEKYFDAAEKVATEAIVVFDPNRPPERHFAANEVQRSGVAHSHGDDALILVSTGDFSVEINAPRAATYVLKTKASETPAGPDHALMEYRLDGKPIQKFTVNAAEPKTQPFEFRVAIPQGKHQLSVAFLNDFYDEKAKDKNRRDRNLIVRDVQLVGPVDFDAGALPESHKRLLATVPSADKSLATAARENLRPFLRRAFRRPVSEVEVTRFVELVDHAVKQGESFPFGMRVAVTAALVSPHFLFRIESDKNPNDSTDKHSLNDYELASRLSYFLWSSQPDDALMASAEKGDLHTDAVLDEHVRRMLKDPKSQALVDNFAEQWLQLRVLNEITPDPKRFPEFNADLREDMKHETRRFFEHVMREDRSILEFLDGTYTFVNERLAKHYGFENVKGPEFQQVSLDGKNRAGLMTQASILTLTSNPDRTSPVKRGKWIMEVILDKPPPPPPPNVPELEESAKAAPESSLRQQLELHRQNAACASCHRVMDQLGFGMENFDAIGRWRDGEMGKPLDTTGELPGGATFKGPVELASVLRGKQCEFGECLAEKMLTYAMGRGLEFYDRCATDKIVAALKQQDFKFSVLVTEIAKSEPFRMRRGEDGK